MPVRFNKRIKIMPGISVNIGKRGVSSVSFGKRGARMTVGKKSVRTTAGVSGTGLSYSKHHSYSRKKAGKHSIGQAQNGGALMDKKPKKIGRFPKSSIWLWVFSGIVLIGAPGAVITEGMPVGDALIVVVVALACVAVGYFLYKKHCKENGAMLNYRKAIDDARRDGFPIVDIHATLRVLDECVELVKTSRYADTVEGRIETGVERAQYLLKAEGYGLHDGNPPASAYLDFFQGEAVERLNEMKTPKHYDTMKGSDFEEFCAELLIKNGFRACCHYLIAT